MALRCASVAFGFRASVVAGSTLTATSARRIADSSRWMAAAACSLSEARRSCCATRGSSTMDRMTGAIAASGRIATATRVRISRSLTTRRL
jgi:hypothetical protein